MTADNFFDVMSSYGTRKPFRLFTIELHGGERFEVDHPFAVAVSREGAGVFIGPGNKIMFFDHDSVLKVIDGRVEAQAPQS